MFVCCCCRQTLFLIVFFLFGISCISMRFCLREIGMSGLYWDNGVFGGCIHRDKGGTYRRWMSILLSYYITLFLLLHTYYYLVYFGDFYLLPLCIYERVVFEVGHFLFSVSSVVIRISKYFWYR